jgi:hypothetical protein
MTDAQIMPKPPLAVKMAVAFLAANYVTGLVRIAFTLHWSEPLAVLVYFVLASLIGGFLWLIYRGRDWARWLLVAWIGIGIGGIPHFWNRYGNGPFGWVALGQIILQESALILLLLPPSFRWFLQSRKSQVSEPTP